MGGIVSKQRTMENGSTLAKILIRKELQHWANESVKENSENMVDYTKDDKKYFILALMTETGEFLQFDDDAYADKVGPFNIDECYNEKNLETLQPWWKKKPKEQA